MTLLNGPVFLPPDDAPVHSVVVMLHGFGANGHDLINLAPLLSVGLPNTAFFAPHAPESTPFNMGYQWYSDADWTFRDKAGTEASHKLITEYLEHLRTTYKLGWKNIVLAGFSQGAMMALYTAPRLPDAIAGVISFSGFMMWHTDLEGRPHQTIPALLLHGEADDVVPADASHDALKRLQSLAFSDITLRTYAGLAHGINAAEVDETRAFLQRVLAG